MLHSRTMRTVCAALVAAVTGLAPGLVLAQPTPEPPPAPVEAPVPDLPTGPVKGRVIDAAGKPIKGATVAVEGTDIKTTTAADGTFAIDAVVGATLVIEKNKFDLAVWAVTAGELGDVVLLPEGSSSETIEMSGEAPAKTPGAATLDRTELQRVPGAGGDIVKALTVMPGVVNLQIPLGYSGVVIRGASPQDSKVLIDDFEVPVLFHNIGFRAVVPADAIASLEFIPGGYDVAYGRASSGIVSLTTRGGAEERSTQTELSMIDGGLLAQGPIGKRTRYMFGLRRSTIDFVLPSIIPESVDLSLTTVPSYWDEQFRIDHLLNARCRASAPTTRSSSTPPRTTSRRPSASTTAPASRASPPPPSTTTARGRPTSRCPAWSSSSCSRPASSRTSTSASPRSRRAPK
jgi:outer membrane receptor protein involved in Fe transport